VSFFGSFRPEADVVVDIGAPSTSPACARASEKRSGCRLSRKCTSTSTRRRCCRSPPRTGRHGCPARRCVHVCASSSASKKSSVTRSTSRPPCGRCAAQGFASPSTTSDLAAPASKIVVLEPDIIKIDRRFVHRVSESPGQARQLGRLLRLVKTLGGKTVVEGVEHAADARICADLGADCGQGYLWGRPTVM
jgi:EAL domain